ncbi:probable transcriptional regulator SLK2 [Macadamia integrifolia]|uniref:probable transcriptional regulator SLK2 n=1 Tax=Macadamia integrifolia TaxID=60698 RepID=UPI001C4ED2AD|nr:probable transcriptional regulator SLK2 [Macadamia integrifolia]XP_042504784.1 probable transcriptional regulator SLK2 [Macadamia integrifolia]
MNRTVLNSTANSGPSVGASSLVTDANSALSGGPHLQRSASINTESYMRLPASPMSFSSIGISGSSVIDGSSIVQQSSHQEQGSQQVQQRQPQQRVSSATSQPTTQIGPVSVPTGPQLPSSLTQEPNNLSQIHKKPRLDSRQEDILQQQVFQQLLHRPDTMQLPGHNPQLQVMIQQQRLRQQQQQQQQILQTLPQMQRAHLQQQQQQQLRQHLQQQGLQSVSAIKRPYENGICARKLMQYIYHHRHRPPDNSIIYWRKFVAEYFAPRSKKRWCLSLYDNVGHHALGVFPQAAMDAWHCDICNSKSGRGFEATFEVLPRLNKIKFDSGVIDELLFVDLPRECRFPSGLMMLEYGKAVQESVYEQLRVVREGQLRIIFTPELKILSWEFCARRHEELLPRRLVTPQVNQLLQVAQKYQNSVAESGSAGLSAQDLQTNCNMFLTAGRQLARNLELQSLNDLGFSKRYVRCLQIAEVVNSMKDLIDFSREQNIGPIESLKSYPRQAATAKLQMQKLQEMEQVASAQGLPTDRNTLNKLMVMNPSLLSNHTNSNHMVGSGGVLNGSAQAAVAMSNYPNLLRQNSLNSNSNMLQQEALCSFNGSNQAPSSAFQGLGLPPVSMQNVPVNGLGNPHQQQQQSLNANSNQIIQQNHPQSSQGNQHMIQQMLQDMMSNNGGGVQQQQQPPSQQHQQQPQKAHGGQNANGNVGEDVFNSVNGAAAAASGGGGSGLQIRPAGGTGMVTSALVGFGNNSVTPAAAAANASSTGGMGMAPKRSNSFKAASSNSNCSGVSGNNSFNQRAPPPDLPQNLHLSEMVQDISQEFTENGIFNSDPGDMSYGWKA